MRSSLYHGVQEEVLSDEYKRIIFYNITARPVRSEYTLSHVFKGQLKMLKIMHNKYE